MGVESFWRDALPFAAMAAAECGEVAVATLAKTLMTSGMSNLVFLVYHNSLGSLILLTFVIFSSRRSDERPPITFSLLCRFFLLGLMGICLMPLCAYAGINYSSPTLSAAISNLVPMLTFLLAIIFRMEKLDLRRSSSLAKSLGTIVSISGAFMVTLYKGSPILMASPPSGSLHLLLAQKSNWVLGGLLLASASLVFTLWNFLMVATVKEYPAKVILVFFYNFFGAIQCAIVALIVIKDPNDWRLSSSLELITIVFSALFFNVFRSNVQAWCLQLKGPVFVASFKPLCIAVAAFMGVIFLGETLYLGSVIGATVIAFGFYAVMWGQANEKDIIEDNYSTLESSPQKAPLLQKRLDAIN